MGHKLHLTHPTKNCGNKVRVAGPQQPLCRHEAVCAGKRKTGGGGGEQRAKDTRWKSLEQRKLSEGRGKRHDKSRKKEQGMRGDKETNETIGEGMK